MALILDVQTHTERGWAWNNTFVISVPASIVPNAPVVIDGVRDAVETYFQGALRTAEDDDLIVGFDCEIRSHSSWLELVTAYLAADKNEFSHEEFWVQGARVQVFVRFVPRSCFRDVESSCSGVGVQSGREFGPVVPNTPPIGFRDELTEETPWDRVGEYQPGRRWNATQNKIER
jgi:hypothetical protein